MTAPSGATLPGLVRVSATGADVDEAGLHAFWAAWAAALRRDVPGLPVDAWPDALAEERVGNPGEHREVWCLPDAVRVVGPLGDDLPAPGRAVGDVDAVDVHEGLGAPDAGPAAGGFRLVLPGLENTDAAEAEVVVAPSHRRRGLGRALLAAAAARARELGRSRLVVWHSERPDADGPGTAFARAVGLQRRLTELVRLLDVTGLDRLDRVEALAEARAEAVRAASAYEVVVFAGSTPDHLVEGAAALRRVLSEDAPLQDLAWGPEEWSADRLREAEERTRRKCQTRLTALARSRDDGHVAALTDIVVPAAAPEDAWQWDTVVLPADRGHRLGLLVKLANLDQLRLVSPVTRTVTTGNASDNAHMVAINDRLGFVVVARFHCEELALT